jgi:hypothetical protein
VGVQPDVRVAPERALAAAQRMALENQLARATDEPARRALQMRLEWVAARDSAIAVPPERLAAFAGAYEGDRTVRVEAGRLMVRRGEGMPEELVPLGGDRFSLAGDARVSFGSGGPAAVMSVERADGTSSSYPRAPRTP